MSDPFKRGDLVISKRDISGPAVIPAGATGTVAGHPSGVHGHARVEPMSSRPAEDRP